MRKRGTKIRKTARERKQALRGGKEKGSDKRLQCDGETKTPEEP